MKILIVILVFLFSSSELFSQEETSLDKLITLKLPSGVKKTDYSSVNRMKGVKAKSAGVSIRSKKGNIYETDAGIIQINAEKGKIEKNRLETLEKGMKDMYGWGKPKYLTSETKSINNFKVLIIDYQLSNEDIGRIRFFTVNDDQNIAMSGKMEYLQGNSKAALKELDKFLRGLFFK